MPLLHIALLEKNNIIYKSIIKSSDFDYSMKFHIGAAEHKIIKEKEAEQIDGINNAKLTRLIIRTNARIQGKSVLINAIGAGSNYMKNSLSVVSGRRPTEEEIINGENVCLASLVFIQKHKLKFGDEILFRGNKIKIIGAIASIYGVPTIVLSTNYLDRTLKNSENYNYTLDVSVDNNIDEIVASSMLQGNLGVILDRQVVNSQQYIEEANTLNNKLFISIVMDTLKMLLLSMISIVLISIGYFLNKQRLYGIKLSVGASYKQLLFEMCIELITYALIATLIDVFIIYKFQHVFVWISHIYVSPSFVLYSMVFSIVFSIIISIISWIFIAHRKPVELISR